MAIVVRSLRMSLCRKLGNVKEFNNYVSWKILGKSKHKVKEKFGGL